METAPTPPGFSICIPVYNGRRFLAETLASIRAQTYPHWELIIAEDASPVPSRDIVEAFAASVSQRVRYVVAPVNQGTAATRDLAMGHATMPLIAVLDADDLWDREHLASLAKCFADPACEFAFSSTTMFFMGLDAEPLLIEPAPAERADLRSAYYYCRSWLPTGAIAFRRTMLARTGPWAAGLEDKPAWLPKRNLSEDRNFLLRVVHAGVQPVWTGRPTFRYRKYPESTTGYTESGIPDRAWCYHYYGLVRDLPAGPQRRFLGYLSRQAGDILRAHDARHAAWFYFRAWRWWPWRVDRLLRAMQTMLSSLSP